MHTNYEPQKSFPNILYGWQEHLNILTGTVSGDVKQRKQHRTITFVGALRGLVSSLMRLQKYSPPSSSFLSSLRGKSSSDMLQESPQPTSLGDSSHGLPLSCHTAESSPHSPYLNQFGSERGSSYENIVQSAKLRPCCQSICTSSGCRLDHNEGVQHRGFTWSSAAVKIAT